MKGLKSVERHELGQAALVQLQLRTDDDDRTAGVIHPLAEQVLAETPALALDHVGERLERPLVGAGHRLAAPAVVEQRIDRLLQHALLVAHDDVGCLEFEQALESVVTVDDAAVEIVEIRGGEAPAVERHERTQIGRQHGQHLEDHPLRAHSGLVEGFQHLEPLADLLDLGIRAGGFELAAQLLDLALDVERAQEFADASAPIMATKSSPYSSKAAWYCSSVMSWPRLSGVSPGSMTT